MKGPRRWGGRLALILWLVLAWFGPAAAAAPARWDDLVAAGEAAGLPRARVSATVQRLSDAGLTVSEGAEVLAPALDAARAGLPAGPVLAKVDEGVLKRVPPGTVAAAARNRLDALESARGLLENAGYALRPGAGRGVLVAVALALESGLPPPALAPVLEAGRGRPFGQVKAVVEAGETLHLAGLAPDTTRSLMLDFLERNLRRPEVFRAARWAREQHGAGLRGDDLRQSVWDGSGAGGHGSGAMGGSSSRGGLGGGGSAGGGMGGHRTPGGSRRR